MSTTPLFRWFNRGRAGQSVSVGGEVVQVDADGMLGPVNEAGHEALLRQVEAREAQDARRKDELTREAQRLGKPPDFERDPKLNAPRYEYVPMNSAGVFDSKIAKKRAALAASEASLKEAERVWTEKAQHRDLCARELQDAERERDNFAAVMKTPPMGTPAIGA